MTQKVHISRDVIVNESEKWKWDIEPVCRSEIQHNHVYLDSSDESDREDDYDEEDTV
ncbi:hypothetical protein A2U01_0119236, partial [Trifolium medium]|nr:hypothetical protein [Trifolium medium]